MMSAARSTRALAVALLAAAMLCSTLQAAETPPEDPAAQAATYSKKAADLRAEADKHEKIAQMHKAGAGSSKTAHESIANHCERLAKQLRTAAEESDAIAAAYRSLAEKK
jgi:hypothetical protein